MDVLVNNFEELGFKLYVDKTWQGPIIATFLYPEGRKFDFQDMYCYIKDRGYADVYKRQPLQCTELRQKRASAEKF